MVACRANAPPSFFRPVAFIELLLKECHNGGLSREKTISRSIQFLSIAFAEVLHESAIPIGVDHPRMDIAFTTNGLGIPESFCDESDGSPDILIRLRL